MNRDLNCGEVHSMSESATTCIARFLARLAALQIVAIAGYYSSLRLAIHANKRTLHAVQLMILG